MVMGINYLSFGRRLRKWRTTLVVLKDIEYCRSRDDSGNAVSLKLDVYHPIAGGDAARPAVILVHGGGFESGDKGYTPAQGNFYPDIATAFAGHGYVVFSLDYRLRMTDYLNAALEDLRCALGWIERHAEEYVIDVRKMLIAGDSAGGAIAVNTSYRSPELHSFAGCIDMWGGLPPYGDPHNKRPVNVFPVTPETPPTCVVHGTADSVVDIGVSRNLCDLLDRAGVYHELHPLDGAGHFPSGRKGQIVTAAMCFADRIIPPQANVQSDESCDG